MHKKFNTIKTQKFIQGLKPFSSAIPHGLKKIFKKIGYNFNNIVDNWSKMLGKDISSSCYPSEVRSGKKVSDGTLVINVIHGREIDIEYKKKEIKDKINSFFGYNYIEQIKLKIVHEKKLLKKKIVTSKIINKKLEKKLNMVKNNDLKNSLNQLIKAFNEKNY